MSGYTNGIEFKIGEYDSEEELWEEVKNHSKDVKYTIFTDGLWFESEADISDARRELKSWKHIFPSEEAFQKAMEIANDGEDDYKFFEYIGVDPFR